MAPRGSLEFPLSGTLRASWLTPLVSPKTQTTSTLEPGLYKANGSFVPWAALTTYQRSDAHLLIACLKAERLLAKKLWRAQRH